MTCCVSCGIIAASDWEGVAYGGEENGPAPLYTRMVVKDALLELLKEKEFSAITVTDICPVAKINRGTLYLHYKNNSDILDELFNDAPNNVNGVYAQLTQEETESLSYGYPLRLFLRKSKKYQPLFFSSELCDEDRRHESSHRQTLRCGAAHFHDQRAH